jgi:hypothetical protein
MTLEREIEKSESRIKYTTKYLRAHRHRVKPRSLLHNINVNYKIDMTQ